MAGTEYTQATCVDCKGLFNRPLSAPGRPRIRCFDCNPIKLGTYKRGPFVTKECACRMCSNTFSSRNPVAKYCSPKCRNDECNRSAQEGKVDRSARPCAFCKQVFTPEYGDLRYKFCSRKCKVSEEYARRPGGHPRKRAREYGTQYEEVDMLGILERDGWSCYICGTDTPAKYRGTMRPDSPVVDHVLALSLGGAHTASNLRCACRKCNSDKGVVERMEVRRRRLNEKASHIVCNKSVTL